MSEITLDLDTAYKVLLVLAQVETDAVPNAFLEAMYGRKCRCPKHEFLADMVDVLNEKIKEATGVAEAELAPGTQREYVKGQLSPELQHYIEQRLQERAEAQIEAGEVTLH